MDANQQAYLTMQASAYLAVLPDEDLRLQITRLFDREFDRQDNGAKLYNELNHTFALSFVGHYWDSVNNKLLSQEATGVIRLRNGTARLYDMGVFYLGLLTDIVRPDMVETLKMIDAYQGEG